MRWLVAKPPICVDSSLLLLRLMMAVVFIFHGSQKLFGAFDGAGMAGFTEMLSGMNVPAPALAAWVSALTEFLGGILIGVGLLTRLTAIPMFINMIVAIILVHPHAFDIQKGGMEYPLTLAVVFAALFIAGPGRFSADAFLAAKQPTM